MAQDVFPKAHMLTIEPIWHMLQKVLKTLSTTLYIVAVAFFMHPHTNTTRLPFAFQLYTHHLLLINPWMKLVQITICIYIEFLELDGFQNYHEPLKANHDR